MSPPSFALGMYKLNRATNVAAPFRVRPVVIHNALAETPRLL